ncbi:MAG: glycosyltransferase family 4 protein [Chloroflexi bacterium]|nr:glycosyltransferase family 4 protein [Chloroflexota bacterium]MXX52364.1 glycosyltransferase family 4 protein [Chloroflexota bacterium]MXX82885.1 glycosyltransferase family 4 protein [Chloroflexota bacterium]MYA91793.1 glycosyltransferase family 4 protein [Chloroflexota bacterium]MYC54275.1 glycosyltransferase family 4 protein [Chloroflexota bacterium]
MLFVVNIPRFFLSHRLSLALAAREAGFAVAVATSDKDSASVSEIKAAGLPFYPLPFSQHGTNPLHELRTLLALRNLYARLQPDLLHHVSIKPVLYGGLAARICRRGAVVHALSGLGYVFADEGMKARLLNTVSKPALKLALAGAGSRVIFQNPDDQRLFIQRGLVERGRTRLIRGSGVDEKVFCPAQEPIVALPVVLYAGRLLWQKGIGDFVEVARRLRGQATFRVVGYAEPSSPLSVPLRQLDAWQAEGLIDWQGKRDDMPTVYAESRVVCLPSTYGEGVPKVLIEAAACARACVTTDTPGCREIVRDGVNGRLVPPGDIEALTTAVNMLLDDPETCRRMGAAGRQIVLDGFTLARVCQDTIALYDELLGGGYISR